LFCSVSILRVQRTNTVHADRPVSGNKVVYC